MMADGFFPEPYDRDRAEIWCSEKVYLTIGQKPIIAITIDELQKSNKKNCYNVVYTQLKWFLVLHIMTKWTVPVVEPTIVKAKYLNLDRRYVC